MDNNSTNKELERLLKQNAELIKDNNELLRKIHRNGLWAFWVRIGWYAVLIGLPFALYFYIFEPYFTALGSDYATFKAGIQEIPGLKSLNNALNSGVE